MRVDSDVRKDRGDAGLLSFVGGGFGEAYVPFVLLVRDDAGAACPAEAASEASDWRILARVRISMRWRSAFANRALCAQLRRDILRDRSPDAACPAEAASEASAWRRMAERVSAFLSS